MSFPQASSQSTQTVTPDPSQVAANAQRLGSLSTLFGQYPGGSPLSAIGGPQGSLAQTFQQTPGEQAFNTGIMGASLPGATLNRALGYTGPQGALGNLFQLNPQSQQLYNQGVQGYNLLTDPTGGPFQNYLRQVVGPMALNNSIAGGFGAPSGASEQALTQAGTQAAMQYAGLYPQLTSSGLNFAQTPQNLALSGLTGLGLPLSQQDASNLFTGLQAAGGQRNLTQQGLSQQLQLAYALQNNLPFTTGITQGGTNQGFNNVLGSIGAPAAATALGLGGSIALANALRGGGAGATGGAAAANPSSGLFDLGNTTLQGGGLFGGGVGGASSVPEASSIDQLLSAGINGGLSFL